MRGKFSQASGCLSVFAALIGTRCAVCGRRRWVLTRVWNHGYKDVCKPCRRSL